MSVDRIIIRVHCTIETSCTLYTEPSGTVASWSWLACIDGVVTLDNHDTGHTHGFKTDQAAMRHAKRHVRKYFRNRLAQS